MFDEHDQRIHLFSRWFAPDYGTGGESYLRARWLFLRGLGAVFLSAFYALWFQIHGLIGTRGILPAGDYLELLRRFTGLKAYWMAPTLLWLDASDAALTALVVIGGLASLALLFNVWPRLSIAVAGLAFLSFIAAAQDFASYQSDGMLLEAAFLSLFFAPRGLRPHLGSSDPPMRAALWLLRFEWFRIFFESGLVKLLSGESQWRNLTAMDKYYENGPLPTWIAWHVQSLPHSFHAATVVFTLFVELFVALLIFFPGRWPKNSAFVVTTLLQLGIIATANYAFLNYLTLVLGILLLDDRTLGLRIEWLPRQPERGSIVAAVVLTAHLITTSLMFFFPRFPLAVLFGPTRIVNNYGLFAVMTRARYEIEFQGTSDGRHWIAYPFRYKPQDVMRRPPVYAPYQPRFDWNLWFASLGTPAENSWVLSTEARLLQDDPQVIELFAGNPFEGKAPLAVRAVLWQYRFTTPAERRESGAWWRRKLVGQYAPAAMRGRRGTIEYAE